MKSTAVNCGNVNMRGKKTKTLACGCCTAEDFREKELEKIHKKEIRSVGRTVMQQIANLYYP